VAEAAASRVRALRSGLLHFTAARLLLHIVWKRWGGSGTVEASTHPLLKFKALSSVLPFNDLVICSMQLSEHLLILPRLSSIQGFQSTVMYLWAAAIFYLVYKVELYIEDDDSDFDSRHSSKHSSSSSSARRRKHRRSGGQSDFSDSLGLPCLPSSELIDKSLDRRVDICEVDSDDDNSTKSK